MASSDNRPVESSDEDEDLLFRITKGKRKRQKVSSSDDSDEDDSDVPVRPKTRRKTARDLRVLDSDSDSDESSQNSTSSGRRKISKSDQKNKRGNGSHMSVPGDSSDSDQADKCAICLSQFVDQDLGRPETCDHVFCSECIEQWAKKVNTCPIDRKSFDVLIIKKHGYSKSIKKVVVEGPENILLVESDYSSDSTYCEMCGESDNEDTLLLCDECELGFHCECLRPPLDAIPEGRWFCPYCAPYIEIREKMLRDFQELVARRFRPYASESTAHSDISPATDSVHEQSGDSGHRYGSNRGDLRFSHTSSDLEERAEPNMGGMLLRRWRGENFRNRRQRFPRSHFMTQGPLATALRPFATSSVVLESGSGNEGEFEFDYDNDHGNVLSSVSHRGAQSAVARTKNLVSNHNLVTRNSSALSCSLRQASSSSSSATRSSVNILGEIIDMQTLLHGPVSRPSFHSTKASESSSNSIVQQCPLNPPHSAPSKCGNNETLQQNSVNSSSSSSGSTSHSQDMNNFPRDSVLGDSVVSADGYESDSLSLVTHRSYGSASIPDEFRRDYQGRDCRRNQSDDDVDIYSDIEMNNNEETSLDADMQTMSMNYESDESRIPPPPPVVVTASAGDGTDSSDNDLVIDEDVPADDDADKTKAVFSNKFGDFRANSPDVNEGGSSSNDAAESHSEQGADACSVTQDSVQSHEEFETNDQGKTRNAQEFIDYGDSLEEEASIDEETNLHSGNVAGSDSGNGESSFIQDSACGATSFFPSEQLEEKSEEWDMSNSSVGEGGCEHTHGLTTDFPSQQTDNEENSCSQDVKFVEDSTAASESGDRNTSPCMSAEIKVSPMNTCDEESEIDEEPVSDEHAECVGDQERKTCCSESAEVEEQYEGNNENSCSAVSSDELEKSVEFRHYQENCCDSNKKTCALGNETITLNTDHISENSSEPKEIEQQDQNLENVLHNPNTEESDKASSCEENQATSNIDLGIEDISDVASDELNQPESCTDFDQYSEDANQMGSIEQNLAQLFDSNESISKSGHKNYESTGRTKGNYQRYSSCSRPFGSDDHEEGEIVEESLYRQKDSMMEHYQEDLDEFMDSAPRVNISDLPRIPKLKKNNVPEEPPLEVKRLSVLGRIDLESSTDISWKRLSQHTRERSYRDGRPKDESVLFREREPRSKSKRSKKESNDGKVDESVHTSERSKRDDSKRQDGGKSKDRSEHREKKSEKGRNDHEKSSKQDDWSYGSSDRREKCGKSHKEKSKKDKKKEKRDRSRDKSSRNYDKYDRDRSEERYNKDYDRYDQSDDKYERSYEKSREKEHKHKHHKSEGKKDKRKRSHSGERYYDKQREREVRKVDDKLKVVVEHKESRKEKDKEKYIEKKELKHEKKHMGHHHQCKKKEIVSSPYSEVTPIESKEIFAQGDSIIINVNFNRASPKDVLPSSEGSCGDQNSNSEEFIKPDSKGELHHAKAKHLFDRDRTLLDDHSQKRPSTPVDRTDRKQILPVGERYWIEADEGVDAKSPSIGKNSDDKLGSEDDGNSVSPSGQYMTASNDLSDSDDNCDLKENCSMLQKEISEASSSPLQCKINSENFTSKDKETDSYSSRRRSPHPPSPPSPPENDSYDPCEPTRSPSPPPPVAPPLPSMSMSDRPKPPPEPELPPLPPEPEPPDSFPHEDFTSLNASSAFTSLNKSPCVVSSPQVSQQPESYLQTVVEPSVPASNSALPPPPSFPPQPLSSSIAMSVANTQLMPPKGAAWQQLPNPPPPPVVFSATHAQPVIRGNFLPSQFPTIGMPPPLPAVSATMLPPAAPLPLLSTVRHLPHAAVTGNQLIGSVPMNNHLSIAHMQVPHLNPPVVSSAAHHQLSSVQNSANVHVPVLSSQVGARAQTIPINTTTAAAVQAQLSTMVSVANQTVSHISTSQSQPSPPVPLVTTIPVKNEKHAKPSPIKDRSEVVDMDVDSPYSPGDSPSVGSSFDFSPPASPSADPATTTVAVSNATTSSSARDAFDSLFENKVATKTSKNRSCVNSETPPIKKSKLDVKFESSSRSRHSVRLQLTDKSKLRKDKHSEKKDVKLDESQLKILDELPSSAVEMQVKEKFLKKLNRQERVVEEVKLALKPYYKTREVSKEEYKDILRKSVPKICHNKSGEINPLKVKHLVECYVKKVKHAKKKAEKRRKTTKFS